MCIYVYTYIYIYIYMFMYTHTYTYIYIYMYTHICLVRHGHRQDVLFVVSVVDIIQLLFNGFRRWFCLMVSAVAGKRIVWFPSPDFRWILPSQEDSKL